MSKVTTLEELYADEMKGLCSANDQMAKALRTIAPEDPNLELTEMLESSCHGGKGHPGGLLQVQAAPSTGLAIAACCLRLSKKRVRQMAVTSTA